jgi:FkbM family methyltransferase
MNTLMLKLRAQGRKLGLHHYVYRIRVALGQMSHYEEDFNRALQQGVRQGDVVWDVGANVGVYTAQFCSWVGSTGHVVAFEPNPNPLAEIRRRLPECPWLTLMDVALGAKEGTASFVADASYSPRSHVQFGGGSEFSSASVIPVKVSTGDAVCESMGRVPNVIKIDVEGFEDDVLLGLKNTLSSPCLRAVFVEVHFQALEDRGRLTAPIEIAKLFKASGFKIKWVDSNHLQAERA